MAAPRTKKGLTDAEVEREIADLLESEDVQLAKAEERIRNRRRQYLYTLRCYEKRGRELREQGYTLAMIREADRMGMEVEDLVEDRH